MPGDWKWRRESRFLRWLLRSSIERLASTRERSFERRISCNGGPLVADLILLLEIAMGVGLLAGAWLARTKRFASHAWCQSLIVLLNMAVVALMMIPSFSVHVLPRIPGRLAKAYYALATAHAGLGTFTELAALYILLSAGTHALPETLRITKYKLWMRSVLALWWGVLLLGIATYTRWYVPGLFRK